MSRYHMLWVSVLPSTSLPLSSDATSMDEIAKILHHILSCDVVLSSTVRVVGLKFIMMSRENPFCFLMCTDTKNCFITRGHVLILCTITGSVVSTCGPTLWHYPRA